MIDRGRIINGLVSAHNYIDIQKRVYDSAYPHLHVAAFDSTLDAITDAIALLKDQEPRLLTAEEVVGCIVLKRDKTLWFEFRDGSIMEISAKKMGYNDFICDEDCPILDDPNIVWRDGDKRDSVIIAEYNVVFRCWDECPTDNQRKAVPWND